MPNWVYNSMSVSGSKETIAEFKELAGRKAPTGFNSETGELTYDDKEEVLSFWNFKEPEDKALYFGASDYKPEGYDTWTSEERMAYSMKFSSNGWYDWNIREWGTKWDACEVGLNDESETSLSYSFSTAWSIPEPVFQAIVQKFPTLDFEFWSEEEQGWGAEFTSSDGDKEGERSLIMTKEWDIPDSHQDYVDRDRVDSCSCQYSDDEEDWYEDCPRETQDYTITLQHEFFVRAKNEEEAIDLIKAGIKVDFTSQDIEIAHLKDTNFLVSAE